VNEDGKADNSSTSQILEIIKLDMQESKRCQEDDMEYCCIQAEDHYIQLEKVWEKHCIQRLRAEDSNAWFEQSSQMFIQLLGNVINWQH
jgi:hypothetical protein